MIRSAMLRIMAISVIILFIGCQGMPSEKPPIHPNPNMDQVGRYDPQAESGFFVDGRTMRQPVYGSVARGELREDDAFYQGMDAKGEDIRYNPVELTEQVLERGQRQYNIYCAPCHSKIGDGQGIIMKYEYPIPPPTFHQDRVRDFTEGYLFNVISNGVRNMPSYKHQIKVEDRWAIIAYVRALQKSQNARKSDIPESILKELN